MDVDKLSCMVNSSLNVHSGTSWENPLILSLEVASTCLDLHLDNIAYQWIHSKHHPHTTNTSVDIFWWCFIGKSTAANQKFLNSPFRYLKKFFFHSFCVSPFFPISFLMVAAISLFFCRLYLTSFTEYAFFNAPSLFDVVENKYF